MKARMARRIGDVASLRRAAARPPFAPWPELAPELAERWRPGEHVSIFGPTGVGKTTVALALAEQRDPVVVLVSKRRDRLIGRLRDRGWEIVPDAEMLGRAGRGGFFSGYFGRDGRPRRVVLWTSPPGAIRARRKQQEQDVRRALDWLYSAGGWTVVLDETLYVSKNLRLAEELEVLWHEGRSSGLSLVACSQRPAWIPRSAYSAPSYLILFGTSDPDDLKRLADIGGGLDTRALRREIALLRQYEFMLVAPRQRPPVLLRSRVEG
jgi:energy-coupling factor transporter ATP-binding protein EcfA2